MLVATLLKGTNAGICMVLSSKKGLEMKMYDMDMSIILSVYEQGEC